jgi:hypothetical protein
LTFVFVSLVAVAAFLLGLRAGIAIGYRAERRQRMLEERRKGDLPARDS